MALETLAYQIMTIEKQKALIACLVYANSAVQFHYTLFVIQQLNHVIIGTKIP
jgi:hypothetical protein